MAHVGKIYNVMAQVLAEDIHKRVHGVREATVSITSQIGKPISQPHVVAVEVTLNPGITVESVAPHIRREVAVAFANIQPFCRALTLGRYAVC